MPLKRGVVFVFVGGPGITSCPAEEIRSSATSLQSFPTLAADGARNRFSVKRKHFCKVAEVIRHLCGKARWPQHRLHDPGADSSSGVGPFRNTARSCETLVQVRAVSAIDFCVCLPSPDSGPIAGTGRRRKPAHSNRCRKTGRRFSNYWGTRPARPGRRPTREQAAAIRKPRKLVDSNEHGAPPRRETGRGRGGSGSIFVWL